MNEVRSAPSEIIRPASPKAAPPGGASPPLSPTAPGISSRGGSLERTDTSRELDLWRNVYRFYFTFRGIENTVEDWSRCMAAAGGIINLYEKDPLAELLVFAVIDWIEKRIKNEQAA